LIIYFDSHDGFIFILFKMKRVRVGLQTTLAGVGDAKKKSNIGKHTTSAAQTTSRLSAAIRGTQRATTTTSTTSATSATTKPSITTKANVDASSSAATIDQKPSVARAAGGAPVHRPSAMNLTSPMVPNTTFKRKTTAATTTTTTAAKIAKASASNAVQDEASKPKEPKKKPISVMDQVRAARKALAAQVSLNTHVPSVKS